MKRKLLVLAGVASSFALMTAVVAGQDQQPPEQEAEQQQAEYAIVMLEDIGGFDGMAVLRGEGNDETEVALGIRNGGGGFLGLGGADEEDIGPAAILMGTCDEPQSVVEEIGELMPQIRQQQEQQQQQDQIGQQQDQQQQEQEAEAHVLAGSIQMGLDELLSGQYVIGVLERQDEEQQQDQQQQDQQQQQQEEINLLACGELTEDVRVQLSPALPQPGEPTDPTAPTPTPVEPMPTPTDPEATPQPIQ